MARKLYKNLMVIHLFPYTADYSREVFVLENGAWLASQRYWRALVKQALRQARGGDKYPPLVIVTRRQQEWYSTVPKLQHKFGKRPKSLALEQSLGMMSQHTSDSVYGRGAYKQVLKRWCA